jgi:enamine deaminase RidA (YjgF/YER057c/UK114 family)
MDLVRHGILSHRCDAVEYGDLVFVAGITADNRSSSFEEQTREVLGKIDKILAQAGTDKTKLLMANIWLTDVANYGALNEIWNAWLPPDQPPARACVGTVLAAERLEVEIAVVAGK